ncbi:MAG: hypothetical protein HC890_14720 [Chloroflexaceae bacterium]|nr:hypothetical protein [Chloroflexaceae bacterium]
MKLKLIEREFLGDWRLLVALLPIICFGIGFRTVNVGEKPFWENDEGYTLLRAAGYTVKEANQDIFAGKVISLSDFRKYLEPSPERGPLGTVIGLASEEPQHPPFIIC